MKNKLILLVIATFLFSTAAFAQKKPVFTSVYSSLNYKTCKVWPGGDGQDDAMQCKGPGGYKVRVYSSVAETYIVAEAKGDSSDGYQLATVSLSFNSNKSTIEWRLANGKPFAAIMRRPTYAERTDGELGFGKVTGSELVVVGLKGQPDLSESIDAKTPNANVKARAAADAGYKAP